MTKSYSVSVSQIRIDFLVQAGSVSWGNHPLDGVDPQSFVGLSNVWGIDKANVYTEWRRRRIDRTTFEFLNSVYVKDRNHVYDYHGIVDGADPNTFACLDAGLVSEEGLVTNRTLARGYARDKNAVYYHDQLAGKATALRNANPSTFVSLGNRFGRDEKSVFYEKLRLPGAVVKKWLHLGRAYSTDIERVYYFNRIVPGVSIEDFRVMTLPLLANYATDGKSFFRGDMKIAEAEFDLAISKMVTELPNWLRAFKQGYCMSSSSSLSDSGA